MSRKQLLICASTLALIAIVPMDRARASNGGEYGPNLNDRPAAPGDDGPGQTAAKDRARKAAQAASTPNTRDDTAQAASGGGDIVVRGIRTSLAKARDTKRKSKTIVDVVEAEDIGKLPNNTLADVIASIPGVSVTREEGEVEGLQLRGLGDVQTTIGGTPVASGVGRTSSIQNLPADLVASVEVYKTRSPDQVEGSGAGTINVVLRKPVDFKPGFTFTGNASGRYNSQARRWNQTYTAITNYRKETAIGDVGAMLGVTLNTNPVLESSAWNYALGTVLPRQAVGAQILPQPTFAPAGIALRYNDGTRTSPAINVALQWAPDEDTSIALEGNYNNAKFDFSTNWLELPVLGGDTPNTSPALSKIVLVPGTNRMASVTVSPASQLGPRNFNQRMNNSNTLLKLSASRTTEQVDLSSEVAYSSGKWDFNEVTLFNRFVNRPIYDVAFASDRFRYPMMDVKLRDLDLLDPNQYRFHGASQLRFDWRNHSVATRSDVTLRTFWNPIEFLKFGFRFADSYNSRRQGGRNYMGLELRSDQMPDGFNKLVPISEGFAGTGVQNNVRWLTYERHAVRDNLENLRKMLATYSPRFANEEIPGDEGLKFNGRERSVAAYTTIGYKTELLLPIDGIIGARVTNTILDNKQLVLSVQRQVVKGVSEEIATRKVEHGRGNYVNVEPTATMVIHFTPKLQTRLSYNVGIRRPGIDQLRSLTVNNEAVGFAEGGNPNLKPETTTRYDSIIEYYFDQTGLITVNPFYWKTKGAFTDFWTLETLDTNTGVQVPVRRPYNAGDGYRRGVEVQAQLFFRFLPGILRNFGVAANYTYTEGELKFSKIPNATTEAPATLPLVGVSRNTYNVTGMFERGTLNARVIYNYNDRILLNTITPLRNSLYLAPRGWMDVAVNYSVPDGPLRNLGFSLQVQNALASVRRAYYGFPDQPEGVTYMARTYGGTIRYRF